MDSFDDCGWDLLDCTFIEDNSSSDFNWSNPSVGGVVETNVALAPADAVSPEKDCMRKRGRNDSFSKSETKACREKLRREKLNDRFLDLSSILEPGRPAITDKLTIIGDAIRVLKQLKTDNQELKDANDNLLEEIKSLKAEKHELRQEKVVLKADKERIKKQLKSPTVSAAGFMPAHPGAYHLGANKMTALPLPSYSLVPMWQYIPTSARDTSRDHELRPPAA